MPMFSLALLFLILLAGLTVVWVDLAIPAAMAAETGLTIDLTHPNTYADSYSDSDSYLGLCSAANRTGYILLGMIAALWPLFWIEPVFCRWLAAGQRSQSVVSWSTDFWSAICPPLRLAKPIAEMDGKIWLPRIGWHAPGKPLAKMLDKVFSKPMLCIALLILPVLGIEFGFSDQVTNRPWLKLMLSILTGMIWCAFAIEFIVMVSATDKKFAYVKKNWIDLAIILLPLVSFLRSLRIVRAANIAKFAKVQQLTKMSRIYRMRGLVAKSIRALMVLEVMHRLLRISPEKRIEKLNLKLADLEEEANEIRSQIKNLKRETICQRMSRAT
jgi:voltage-gated potassium channel